MKGNRFLKTGFFGFPQLFSPEFSFKALFGILLFFIFLLPSYSGETKPNQVDEIIFRRFLFLGMAIESGDLPWFATAVAPSTAPGWSDHETAFRKRWLDLATAYNSLIGPGRPNYDKSIAIQVRTANEESVAAIGSKPNLFQLREDFSQRLIRRGILNMVIEIANNSGSKMIQEIPPRLIPKEVEMKKEAGVQAFGPRRTFRYPCEEIFLFCAGSRKIIVPPRTVEHLAKCISAHARLMKNPDFAGKFNSVLTKTYEKAQTIDIASSKEIGGLMSEFFTSLEAGELAAALETEAEKGDLQ